MTEKIFNKAREETLKKWEIAINQNSNTFKDWWKKEGHNPNPLCKLFNGKCKNCIKSVVFYPAIVCESKIDILMDVYPDNFDIFHSAVLYIYRKTKMFTYEKWIKKNITVDISHFNQNSPTKEIIR